MVQTLGGGFKMKACKLRKALTSLVTSMIFVSYLVMPCSALGQTANSGVITGVVKDQSGAIVAGATVRAINKGTGVERRTTASDSGVHELAQMVPGEYRVEVDAKGFAKFAADPVTVSVLQRTTLDPDLRPGGSSVQ